MESVTHSVFSGRRQRPKSSNPAATLYANEDGQNVFFRLFTDLNDLRRHIFKPSRRRGPFTGRHTSDDRIALLKIVPCAQNLDVGSRHRCVAKREGQIVVEVQLVLGTKHNTLAAVPLPHL